MGLVDNQSIVRSLLLVSFKLDRRDCPEHSGLVGRSGQKREVVGVPPRRYHLVRVTRHRHARKGIRQVTCGVAYCYNHGTRMDVAM